MLSRPNLRCNLCESDNCEIFLTTKFDHILKCRNCGLVFASSKTGNMDARYSEEYFLENYLNERYRAKRIEQAKNRIEEVKKFQAGGKLLDIGCGTGDFLKIAGDAGYHAEGVEISGFAQRFCKDRGLIIHLGDLLKLNLSEDSFDCITMWDLIEHVSSPKAYIGKARQLLKKNGVLAIKTPNVGSELLMAIRLFRHLVPQTSYLLHPYKHIFYFTPETLSKLLESCGFKVLSIKMADELKKKVYHKDLIKSLIKRTYFNSIKNYLKLRGVKESFVIFGRKG